jgi:hypothetical protein
MFDTEADLVDTFVERLALGRAPWKTQGYQREFDYVSGRTDIVAISGRQVLAFEAKLRDWRKALRQAWRNSSFANRVYVVLPADCARRALEHRQEFEARGVGLCAVGSDGRLIVLIAGAPCRPVLPWLREKALGLPGACA